MRRHIDHCETLSRMNGLRPRLPLNSNHIVARPAIHSMFILDHSSLLLAAPRNVFTAIGLPLVVGMYSGSYTPKAANGKWYNVSIS